MPRPLITLLALIITLSVPPLLILANVYALASPAWLTFQYNQPGFPASVRFSDAERRYNATESIEYVIGNRTYEQFKALNVYDDRELKHMVDVRVLIEQTRVFYALDAILVIIAISVLAGRATVHAPRAMLNGAILTIAFFAAAGIFAAVGFQTFFTLFHRLFFEGETWLFNYTDSLIQFYPLPFWFATSLTLIIATIGEAIIVGAIGWWWQRKIKT
ncbi:MAG: TIGR01906 family membrane protein [Chloroflexi bacterium]|nr:TIGR01906 family membrane protein [Chloroflexota bacterium]